MGYDDMWHIAISNREMKSQYGWAPPKAAPEKPTQETPKGQMPLPGMPHARPLGRPIPYGSRFLKEDNRHDEKTWGALAERGVHNPFLDDNTGSWGRGKGYTVHTERENRNSLGEHSFQDLTPQHSRLVEEATRRIQKHTDNAHPIVNVSSKALHGVLDSGRFKTMFETGHSGGFNSEGVRSWAEDDLFGYHPKLHPAHARPIYGSLAENPFENTKAKYYGDHTVVLHKHRVWHRTTAMVGDSLDEDTQAVRPAPAQKMRPSAISPEFLAEGRGSHDERKANQIKEISQNFTHDNRYSPEGGDYTEAHYHGGVSTKDIHYVILREGGPDVRGVKQKLDEHGIPWVHAHQSGGRHQIIDHSGLTKETALHVAALTRSAQ